MKMRLVSLSVVSGIGGPYSFEKGIDYWEEDLRCFQPGEVAYSIDRGEARLRDGRDTLLRGSQRQYIGHPMQYESSTSAIPCSTRVGATTAATSARQS
jgi:hypothetical protein